jgi:hypothetical protein
MEKNQMLARWDSRQRHSRSSTKANKINNFFCHENLLIYNNLESQKRFSKHSAGVQVSGRFKECNGLWNKEISGRLKPKE